LRGLYQKTDKETIMNRNSYYLTMKSPDAPRIYRECVLYQGQEIYKGDAEKRL